MSELHPFLRIKAGVPDLDWLHPTGASLICRLLRLSPLGRSIALGRGKYQEATKVRSEKCRGTARFSFRPGVNAPDYSFTRASQFRQLSQNTLCEIFVNFAAALADKLL